MMSASAIRAQNKRVGACIGLGFATLLIALSAYASFSSSGDACREFANKIEANHDKYMARVRAAKDAPERDIERMVQKSIAERVGYLQDEVVSATPKSSGCAALKLEELQGMAKSEIATLGQLSLALEAESRMR